MFRRLAATAIATAALLVVACADGAPIRTAAIDPAIYRLDAGQALLDLSLEIASRAEQPLVAHALEYELRLEERTVAVGNVSVGGAAGLVVPAGGVALLELPIRLGWEQLPASATRVLERGRSLQVALRGNLLLRREDSRRSLAVPFTLDTRLVQAD